MASPERIAIVSATWVGHVLRVGLSDGAGLLRRHADLMDARQLVVPLRLDTVPAEVIELTPPFDTRGAKGVKLNGTVWSLHQLEEARSLARRLREDHALAKQHIETLDPSNGRASLRALRSHGAAVYLGQQRVEGFDPDDVVSVQVALPKHVEGCRCTDCEVVRAHLPHVELQERELSCATCKRVFARVRAQPMATVEVICKGCEVEGRVKP